jgi:hypothetical protein
MSAPEGATTAVGFVVCVAVDDDEGAFPLEHAAKARQPINTREHESRCTLAPIGAQHTQLPFCLARMLPHVSFS